MRVFGHSTDDVDDWTKPFPTARIGFKARLMGGDVLDPQGFGCVMRQGREGEKPNWFNSLPERVYRGFVDTARLPYFAFGLWRFGGYMGWKIFGVDSPAYLDYPGVQKSDVYPGSQAMCLSIRFTTAREWRHEP